MGKRNNTRLALRVRKSHLQESPENASTPRLYLDGGDIEPGLVKPTQELAVACKVFCSHWARGVQAVPVVQDHGRVREKRRHALRSSQGAEGDRDACTLLRRSNVGEERGCGRKMYRRWRGIPTPVLLFLELFCL